MTTTTPEIDWEAAEALAGDLGNYTRLLVERRDIDQAITFATGMASQHDNAAANRGRAFAYRELARLLGWEPPPAVSLVDDAPESDEVTRFTPANALEDEEAGA